MKFGSNKRNEVTNAGKVTVLSLGFELTGDIISKSDIRADGILVGSIRTDKKVVVGESASITGDIIADEISISGEVTGDLYINGETTIYASAKVSGSIMTNQIYIHKGAVVNSCIKTVSRDEVMAASKSSKIHSVSRDELYSLLDDKVVSAPPKEVPVKPIATPKPAPVQKSEMEEPPRNYPRTW